MGLFSGLYKPEVNEYIAATRNRRGQKTFVTKSPQAAPLLRLSAYLVSNISLLYSPGSGEDGWSTHSGEKGQPGDVTLEESAENLRGKEMLLSGAQGLSERSELTGAPLCT